MVNKIVISVIVGLALTGCAMNYKMKPPSETIMDQHIPGSVFDKTEQGFYTTELVLKPRHPVVGEGRGYIIIHNHEAVDTPGLDVTATLYRKDTGEKSSIQPVVKGERKGLYRVNNLYYESPGIWILKLEITGYQASDVVSLTLPEVKKDSGGAAEEEVPVFGLD